MYFYAKKRAVLLKMSIKQTMIKIDAHHKFFSSYRNNFFFLNIIKRQENENS